MAVLLLGLATAWFWFSFIASLEGVSPLIDRWRVAGHGGHDQAIQTLAPLATISAAALFAAATFVLWQAKVRLPSTPTLAVLGLLTAAGAYFLYGRMATAASPAPPFWFAVPPLLLVLTEVLLVPVLAAASTGFGDRLNAFVVGLLVVGTSGILFTDAAETLGATLPLMFSVLGGVSLGLAALLWLARRPIRNWLSESARQARSIDP